MTLSSRPGRSNLGLQGPRGFPPPTHLMQWLNYLFRFCRSLLITLSFKSGVLQQRTPSDMHSCGLKDQDRTPLIWVFPNFKNKVICVTWKKVIKKSLEKCSLFRYLTNWNNCGYPNWPKTLSIVCFDVSEKKLLFFFLDGVCKHLVTAVKGH